jgi:hypothetical protein
MSVTVHNRNSLFFINYATQIVSFIAVTPFVFLRLFARWKLQHTLGIDDGTFVTCLTCPLVDLLKINLESFLFCWMGMNPSKGNTYIPIN